MVEIKIKHIQMIFSNTALSYTVEGKSACSVSLGPIYVFRKSKSLKAGKISNRL